MTYTPQGPFTTGGTATAANLTAMDAGITAAATLNGSTPMTGSLTLATGHQETGGANAELTTTVIGQILGVDKTFRMQMTNVPSSITLTVAASANMDAAFPQALGMTKYGFLFAIKSAAAGICFWEGTFVTVGNCLLAVDEEARTFDHHCDGCGVVRRGIPIEEAATHDGGRSSRRGLAYFCPCGTSEHFHTQFTAADEADETPQGAGGPFPTTRGAQAALIRALQRLVELPLSDE